MNKLNCPTCGRRLTLQSFVNILIKQGLSTQEIRNELVLQGIITHHKNPLASVSAMVKRTKKK